MRKSVLTAIIAVVLVAVGLGVFVACTGPDDPAPEPTSTATPGPEGPEGPDDGNDGWTTAQIETAVLGGAVEDEVLGSAEGAVPDRVGDHPARVEVTAVRGTEATTVVWFTLTNLQDGDASLPIEAFNQTTPLTQDIRDVALLDADADLRLLPYVAVLDRQDTRSFCTCAHSPKQITTKGQLLSATFPAVPEGTTTVALELPGFPVIEDLPVSRD